MKLNFNTKKKDFILKNNTQSDNRDINFSCFDNLFKKKMGFGSKPVLINPNIKNRTKNRVKNIISKDWKKIEDKIEADLSYERPYQIKDKKVDFNDFQTSQSKFCYIIKIFIFKKNYINYRFTHSQLI